MRDLQAIVNSLFDASGSMVADEVLVQCPECASDAEACDARYCHILGVDVVQCGHRTEVRPARARVTRPAGDIDPSVCVHLEAECGHRFDLELNFHEGQLSLNYRLTGTNLDGPSEELRRT